MKAAIFTLATIAAIQAAPAFAEPTLVSLDCVSNTGVIIQTTGVSESGISVDAKWGIFERKFIARKGISALGATSYVELHDGKRAEYFLALKIKSDTTEVQKISGALLQAPAVEGLPPTVIGAVQCDVVVK